jgi:BirA family biotin operon repressor/biotin-[acetyl-CoA-carboxylase] ligase
MIIGRRVIVREQVASTMDEVDALAVAGEEEGLVVVAEEQTAGRGRAGRSWHAPPGTCLLCSILLRPTVPPDRLTALPLLFGAAVAEAIEAVAPVTCRLKWPNDVWINGRKVAGILITARCAGRTVSHATLGIGINVNVPAAALPPGASSLLGWTGQGTERAELLEILLSRCDRVYHDFCANQGRVSLDSWRARAALLGETVQVQNGIELITGVFEGVSDDGALLIREEGGEIRRIVAGDLARGPVAVAGAEPAVEDPVGREGNRRLF